MPRYRIGNRRHLASFEQHNGRVDPAGNPTLEVDSDWEEVISGWPCEVLSTGGGEMIRGRQIHAETTHVMFGEFFAVEGVKPAMRARVATFPVMNITAAIDPDGNRQEMRIEARAEP